MGLRQNVKLITTTGSANRLPSICFAIDAALVLPVSEVSAVRVDGEMGAPDIA
jgi:hypothetical protein